MPSRIDSPSIPGAYFSGENTTSVAPAAAPSLPPARSSGLPRAIRSGGQNLERFFASMNCFGGGPSSLDVGTEAGRAHYKLAVRAWAARPPSYVQEFRDRKAIAERIARWLEANDPDALLDLSSSKLKSLPPLPSNLRSLNISDVFHASVPGKYPKTWPAGLRELNISHNNLRKLPDNLPDTLTTLAAASCGLTRLPKLPQSLEKLHVAGNRLDVLPGGMPPGLRVLDASSNNFTGISAGGLGSLTELNLSNNPLGFVPHLPRGLTRLHLDGAELLGLPRLPSGLVELSVKGNMLERFIGALPPGLKILDAGSNPFFKELPGLPDGLERLSINRTSVSALPAAPPANLRYLNISHTQVTQVSDQLFQAVARPHAPLTLVAEGIALAGLDAAQANQPAVGTANGYGVGMASLSLSQAVEAWYGAPDARRSEAWDRIYRDSQDGLANATVPLWKVLDSLAGTADHPLPQDGETGAEQAARNDMRTAFKQRVTALLGAIESDQELRKTCLLYTSPSPRD